MAVERRRARARDTDPNVVVQAIASMSFIGHFQRITDGVFEASALVFFISLIAFALWLNVQILDARKAA